MRVPRPDEPAEVVGEAVAKVADDQDERPPAYVDLHRESRERFRGELPAAAIPVELIPRLVLIAGGGDKVWPSLVQADAIRDSSGGSRVRNHTCHGARRGSGT